MPNTLLQDLQDVSAQSIDSCHRSIILNAIWRGIFMAVDP